MQNHFPQHSILRIADFISLTPTLTTMALLNVTEIEGIARPTSASAFCPRIIKFHYPRVAALMVPLQFCFIALQIHVILLRGTPVSNAFDNRMGELCYLDHPTKKKRSHKKNLLVQFLRGKENCPTVNETKLDQ